MVTSNAFSNNYYSITLVIDYNIVHADMTTASIMLNSDVLQYQYIHHNHEFCFGNKYRKVFGVDADDDVVQILVLIIKHACKLAKRQSGI